MSKTLTEMADKALTDAMSVQRCDDDLIHAVERIAEVVRAIAGKLEGEQPAPDVLGRVLELADNASCQWRANAKSKGTTGSYLHARDSIIKAESIDEFANLLRAEFNRD